MRQVEPPQILVGVVSKRIENTGQRSRTLPQSKMKQARVRFDSFSSNLALTSRAQPRTSLSN